MHLFWLFWLLISVMTLRNWNNCWIHEITHRTKKLQKIVCDCFFVVCYNFRNISNVIRETLWLVLLLHFPISFRHMRHFQPRFPCSFVILHNLLILSTIILQKHLLSTVRWLWMIMSNTVSKWAAEIFRWRLVFKAVKRRMWYTNVYLARIQRTVSLCRIQLMQTS